MDGVGESQAGLGCSGQRGSEHPGPGPAAEKAWGPFLWEKTGGLRGPLGEPAHTCAASQVYKGYMDDPRNTDNAWIETVALSVHFPDQGDVELKRLNSVCGRGLRL